MVVSKGWGLKEGWQRWSLCKRPPKAQVFEELSPASGTILGALESLRVGSGQVESLNMRVITPLGTTQISCLSDIYIIIHNKSKLQLQSRNEIILW